MSVCLVRVEGPDPDGPTHNRRLSDHGDLGAQVTLPVVLGRGSLLKCGDKRVSRRHAYLDWEDKGVLLTAVHQNPTYVVVGKGELQEVMEGSSVLLSHGDRFGLLKDTFWYMVSLPNTLTTEEKKPAPSSERREEEKEEETKEEEKDEEVEKRKEEKCEKRKEEEEERKEEDKKENSNSITKEAKGELIDKKKLGVGDGEAVNGDTVQEAVTTTRRIDATDGGTVANGEEENKALKAERGPQHQKGTEGAAGDTKTHNSSSPSSTPSTARPCAAPSPKEKVVAVSGRERNLPQWLQNTSSGSPATTPLAPATPRGRRERSRPPAASPRTQANSTTPAPPQSDGDLFSLNTASKRQRKGSPHRPRNTTAKTPKSPQKRQNQTASPAKRKGNVHHQMSDDSDGDDAAATTTTITITTTSTTTTATTTNTTTTSTASPSSPHTPARRIPPAPNQISDSEGEAEEQGVGGSTNPPTGASPAAARPAAARPAAAPPAAAPPAAAPATAPTTPGRTPPRPSCQFGAKCYRKNPLHRQSEAHPGDPDYHSPGDGDSDGDGGGDDDRPECEYGVDCYRKNPQHRKAFKHTRFPQPQRRAKRKARQQKARQAAGGGDGSEEDDYDFDDPFLNDGSSDDYAPTDDSSDSAMEPSQEGTEEEDTKRMLKEAKKFVKKRK